MVNIAKNNTKYRTLNYPIRSIVDKFKDGSLILNPEMQRKYVWNLERASKLVDTLINGLPIHDVYAWETTDNDWLIIDGKQRLTSIISYVMDKNPTGEDGGFKLKLREEPSLNRRKFSELEGPIKNKLLDTTLTIRLFDKTNDPAIIVEMFERLNQGQKPLNRMEIRHGLGDAKLNKFLGRLSQNNLFRAMCRFRSENEIKGRMIDVEFALAFVVYYHIGYQNFKYSNQSQFLSYCFKELLDLSIEEESSIEEAFNLGLKNCNYLFGKTAFDLPDKKTMEYPINPDGKLKSVASMGIFNTLTPALAHIPHEIVVQKRVALREKLGTGLLKSNRVFRDCVTHNGKSDIMRRNSMVDDVLRLTIQSEHIANRLNPIEV